jgi:transcriptional regulator with XRE-family HTH domain
VTGADHPLRRLRRRRGMSQVALAGLAGLSPSFISMVENGHRGLTRLDHISALAAALRVPPGEVAAELTTWSGVPAAPGARR